MLVGTVNREVLTWDLQPVRGSPLNLLAQLGLLAGQAHLPPASQQGQVCLGEVGWLAGEPGCANVVG